MDVFTFELYVLRYTLHFRLKLHKTDHLKQIGFFTATLHASFYPDTSYNVIHQTYNLKKRVMLFLKAYGCLRAMAGINDAIFRKSE
jgi:hypothetical protein